MEVETNDFSDRFQQAVAEDQKWIGQIFMPDPKWKTGDIVPFYDPSYIQEIVFQVPGFPKASSFLFHS